MTVLMGTLPETTLSQHMARADALVVMKIGRNLEKVRRAITQAGRLSSAWLVEYATMPDEKVSRLSDVTDTVTPYFSIVIVHGQGRRP
jgi:precorrin-2/cobalt-factor-2 C20-methyltransferase